MATGKRRASQVRHRGEDLDEWARSLHRRFGGPIAIAVELSKGTIINVLQKYDFFVTFPIDPSKLANHRKTFTTSGAKDDPTGAEFALDLLSKHTEHFKPLKPRSVEMRTLMTLVGHRRQLINDRVRITNRLRNALKQYYPEPLEWLDHIDTLLFCDFIQRWPSLFQARRLSSVSTETSLQILAYNMKRATNRVGTRKIIEMIHP